MTPPRLMSGADAAAYCGVSPETFSKWVAAGTVPAPMPGTRRWDRKAIDLALDKASGIPVAYSAPERDADLAWKAHHEAEQAAVAGTGDMRTRYHWKDKFDAAWAEWLIEHDVWKATQPPSKHWSPGGKVFGRSGKT
jgi:excisionase family DNA binding protein